MTARGFLALALLALCSVVSAAPPRSEARAFDATSLETIRRAYAGRPFVLSLWSVHCEPCRHEMPLWRELQARYPDVRVVLVAADNPAEGQRIERFLERHDPGPAERWRYADDFEERIRYSIDPKWRGELPRTYFFDAAHRAEARTGVPDAKWAQAWFERASTAGRGAPGTSGKAPAASMPRSPR
jgi:thiol-disulfide isomerase/thioredoxin